MNISYSWLKDYIDTDLSPAELSSILTQTGLEVGSIEEVETIKGGLKGLVIGEVKSCEAHPDSDHLSKTTVDVGEAELLPIVCGAPNVAAGQKVVVAVVGTILYDGDNEFKIKKSKIRGEVSMGMICAEDEIGLGESHDGIMVLPSDAPVGKAASEYFNVENDYIIEIDLTPNRVDGSSHIGVARDLAAFLKQQNDNITYSKPSVDDFKVDNDQVPVTIDVRNSAACPIYTGVSIRGVKVESSPEWLQKRLIVIGLTPINNIVDITNYVLFETGQPLHAFDMAKIKGNKIVVETLAQGTKFTTLDEVERELDAKDLMICNESEGMCIAGVFGGLDSGVKDTTTDIFLESAYFNPVYVRKTARRHGLSTDSSFRFERGVDPNGNEYALKRAALLIKEIAGGQISGDIQRVAADDAPTAPFEVVFKPSNARRLIGKDIDDATIEKILVALEIEISKSDDDTWNLKVPAYRVDVQREADVVEDILRIYGYNNVQPGTAVKSTIQYSHKPNKHKLQNMVSDSLSACGFNEIWSNSLGKASNYDGLNSYPEANLVKLFNPLSQDLNVMRENLLFGGLEAVERNTNFRNGDLSLYEFGNVYTYDESIETDNHVNRYHEEEHLGLWLSGNRDNEGWQGEATTSSFYTLKSYVINILEKLGITEDKIQIKSCTEDIYSDAIQICQGPKVLATLGYVAPSLLKKNGIKTTVFYADIHWTTVLTTLKKQKVQYTPLPKYPEVRRDLALLVDKSVTFDQLKAIALKGEKNLLRKVDIFDVYEGEHLPEGKKSYALSFILRDDKGTLKDKQIDKIMNKMIKSFEHQVGASLR
ncbi:phenylalanine--tRNA ligase subunit beta [Halosquirtibacter xylanolyticus]|uniref:phenylalanine--tRNA ligase subunit beta n=1 Tax=Halosquirtibacter xylanolyticus TaxID=3374599 RepID=UPI0037488823|nr:phenylalanine--tRNA ligase subunit beta [Prolixibacteraceae bacterium]